MNNQIDCQWDKSAELQKIHLTQQQFSVSMEFVTLSLRKNFSLHVHKGVLDAKSCGFYHQATKGRYNDDF